MRILLVLLAAILAVPGCSRSPSEPSEVLTLYVGPEQVDCVGMAPQKCLLVRHDPSEPWTWLYEGIEGFAWEPGFTYTLLVRRHTLANPPQDSSSVEWKLIIVIDKVPATGT